MSLAAIFLVAVVAVTALIHLAVNRFTEHSVSLAELATSEAVLLILAASVVVTLAVGSLVLMLWPSANACDISHRYSRAAANPAATPIPETLTAANDTRQILRLTRNAERLDTVEQDLIRAMANGEPLSDYTRNLLTEMRICTCKLLGELSDIDRSRDESKPPADKRSSELVRN